MNQNIILFDGMCNLCEASVLFIINRDRLAKFTFATLQSNLADKLLAAHSNQSASVSENDKRLLDVAHIYDSVIYIKKDQIYFKSRAALEIARQLDGLWPILYILLLIPGFIRDPIYSWVAKHRFKWFGKKLVCIIPTPELQKRFINDEI